MGSPVSLHEAVRIARRQGAAGAGIERAQDLDRLEQCLASGGSMERQSEERRQVLAERAVAREHGVEMTARLQPLVGPASDRRLDQRRGVQCLAQGADGLRTIRRHQRIDRAEHAVQPIAGAAAQRRRCRCVRSRLSSPASPVVPA